MVETMHQPSKDKIGMQKYIETEVLVVQPGCLTLSQLRKIQAGQIQIQLDSNSFAAIDRCAQVVQEITQSGLPAYGINTGFGRLANKHIALDQLALLQKNLVLSHATGVGQPMSAEVVRLLIVLKLSSLGRGHSGVRRQVIEALIALFNADILPVIPVKGSVGASGDLSPLAHMSCVLLGVGEVFVRGTRISAAEGLQLAGIEPIELQAKEGLALLNGTQASTALALHSLFAIEDVFKTALVAGALSVDAAYASTRPFDDRIHQLRGHEGQILAAQAYRTLLQDSQIHEAHQNDDCKKVQDPYCLRCQPQVMGACLDQIQQASRTLLTEANAVSDNPLIFPDTKEAISGGNFHAEPVAFAADNLALAIAEIGAIAERRIALLVDASMSGLPAFLVKEGGINSGFMIAHVTAAALASENKTFAHPASVDSLPTSANQEDHVSMATFAARKLSDMVENVRHIVAIELLAAAQGIDFRAPLKTSLHLQKVHQLIRAQVSHYDVDRYFSQDIQDIAQLVLTRQFATLCPYYFDSEL